MAFFWHPPLPPLELEPDAVGCASSGCQPSAGSFFWRLPLPPLELESDASGCDSAGCEPSSRPLASLAPGYAAGSFFWRPPLPAPLDGLSDEEEAVAKGDAGAAAEVKVEVEAPNVVAEEQQPLSLGDNLQGLVDRFVAERSALETNLRELATLQERLRLTMEAASAPRASDVVAADAGDVRQAPAAGLPAEVISDVLWHLDVCDMGRCSALGRDWRTQARSPERWRLLCEQDWGVGSNGNLEEYRRWLARWRQLQQTFEDLKHFRSPSGAFGSHARRRIFESLHTLADLGAAGSGAATYPARVPALMAAARGGASLLTLLEDESPYLSYLSVRCLADLAASESERPLIREAVTSRGSLVRQLLEGEDTELVEVSARMMLNLHGQSPGVPILARRRGPLDFLAPEPGEAAEDSRVSPAFAPWSGAWVGEMRYARGGERHSALQLVLGPEGDPSVEQARVAFRSLQEEARTKSGGAHSESHAVFWHYFGFLAASDFDCAAESVAYVNEQLARRHAAQSPSNQRGVASSAKLEGAGYDDQNGAFTLEAFLPQLSTAQAASGSPSAGGKQAATSPSVPVHLLLQYEGRGSKYELTGFLAGGLEDTPGDSLGASIDPGGGPKAAASRVLFGVWATAPSQHKHLFALRRVSPLPRPCEPGSGVT